MLLSTAGLSVSASAATSASDMAVTADLNANCIMSSTDLAFGAYDPIVANAALDLRATATVSTTCTSGATGVVTMSQGDHFLYCVNNDCLRQLANAEETGFLRYNIYTSASYYMSNIWNNDVEEMSSVPGFDGIR
jgi:spore coat protein U-like protein